jgi:hypothetical protein
MGSNRFQNDNERQFPALGSPCCHACNLCEVAWRIPIRKIEIGINIESTIQYEGRILHSEKSDCYISHLQQTQ